MEHLSSPDENSANTGFTRLELGQPEHDQTEAAIIRRILPPEIAAEVAELELPSGYGLIGGAARAVALRVLRGEELPVRDVDVAAFTEFKPDMSTATVHQVSKTHMPDDYSFGHGVKQESLTNYFKTRDFTMNEVAVVNGQLLMSPRAADAIINNVIEPTEYEHDLESGLHLEPKLAVKAVLQASVLEEVRGSAEVRGLDLPAEVRDVEPFFLALGLQKSLEHGPDITYRYLDKLVQYGALGDDDLTPRTGERIASIAHELQSRTWSFSFRGDAQQFIEQHSYATLGDWMWAIAPDAMDDYDHYRELAARHRGPGSKYTDESKY